MTRAIPYGVASTVNGEPNPSVIYQFHLQTIISVEIDLAVVSMIPAPPNVATAALWGPRYSTVARHFWFFRERPFLKHSQTKKSSRAARSADRQTRKSKNTSGHGSSSLLKVPRAKSIASQRDYFLSVFSLSSARFNSSSFCPASPSLPSAVSRW
jgi:hypothetical protein